MSSSSAREPYSTNKTNRFLDDRNGTDFFEIALQYLRPFGEAHDLPSTAVRFRVHGLVALHGLPGNVHLYHTHCTRVTRQPSTLQDHQPAQVARPGQLLDHRVESDQRIHLVPPLGIRHRPKRRASHDVDGTVSFHVRHPNVPPSKMARRESCRLHLVGITKGRLERKESSNEGACLATSQSHDLGLSMLHASRLYRIRPGRGLSQYVLELHRFTEPHGQTGPHRAPDPCVLAAAHLADLCLVVLGAYKLCTLPAVGAGQTGVAGARSGHRGRLPL